MGQLLAAAGAGLAQGAGTVAKAASTALPGLVDAIKSGAGGVANAAGDALKAGADGGAPGATFASDIMERLKAGIGHVAPPPQVGAAPGIGPPPAGAPGATISASPAGMGPPEMRPMPGGGMGVPSDPNASPTAPAAAPARSANPYADRGPNAGQQAADDAEKARLALMQGRMPGPPSMGVSANPMLMQMFARYRGRAA